MNDQPHADDPGLSCGVAMTRLLERAGVRHVFGIPGNHTLELYRGLDQSSIQHITTRHEQGAAFMADGYARATGQPGVCYLISGPGLLNAATPLGQALADSVPVLVITAVAALPDLGKRFGKLHELPDQQAAARSFCRESLQIRHATDLIPALERAWLIFEQERPGPAHIEIPLDVMESAANAALLDEFSDRFTSRSTRYGRHQSATAHQATIDSMAKRLQAAQQPALLLGGGSQRCDPTLLQRLAETLDAPVANTVNAKGLISPTHPLALGSSPSAPTVADVLRTSDCVLALGTEFSETDYDLLMAGPFGFTGDLLRIDIDPGQLNRNHTPLLSLCTAVEAALPVLLDRLAGPAANRLTTGTTRVQAARTAMAREPHAQPEFRRFFETINSTLPESCVVGDSTRPTYYATWLFERARPRSYFHSASGFGTLGYAIPAAFGAAAGTASHVLAIIGDGGAQFTLPELATGVDAQLPVTVLIWCNRGYEEIENSLDARGVSNRSTDISSPDFRTIAEAYGITAYTPGDWNELARDLRRARDAAVAEQRPNLLLIDQEQLLSQPSGNWYS